MTDLGYVLAKIHGIHSKSVNGSTLDQYRRIDTIDKLEKTLFASESIETPTKKLYTKVEDKFRSKIMKQITDITRYLGNDNKLINAFLTKTECENVKQIVHSFIYKSKLQPLTELDIPRGLDYRLIERTDLTKPDSLSRILTGTIYEFVLDSELTPKNVLNIDNKLDKFCYANLLEAANSLHGEQRQKMISLITEESDLLNIIWAIRLKQNYKIDDETIKSMLITGSGLISPADIAAMTNSSDITDSKAMCKYKHLLQQHDEEFDIIEAEKTFRDYISHKYQSMFAHEYNILSIAAYISLKNREYDDIVQIVETMRYKA